MGVRKRAEGNRANGAGRKTSKTEVKEQKDGGSKLQKEEWKPPAFMKMEASYSIKAVGGAEFFILYLSSSGESSLKNRINWAKIKNEEMESLPEPSYQSLFKQVSGANVLHPSSSSASPARRCGNQASLFLNRTGERGGCSGLL